MGEGDTRSTKRAMRLDGKVLAEVARGTGPAQVISAAEASAAEASAAEVASDGAATSGALPGSRTVTLDDPLTTSLLAEVARRSKTLDVAPEQIAEARDVEPGALGVDPPDDPAPRTPR